MKIELNDNEIAILLSALATVAPVGGGSSTHSLQLRLMKLTGAEPSESLVLHMCDTVLEGAIECGVVARVN